MVRINARMQLSTPCTVFLWSDTEAHKSSGFSVNVYFKEASFPALR
jgi:hypothetical protein